MHGQPIPAGGFAAVMPNGHAANRRDLPVSIVGLTFVVGGAIIHLFALVGVTWFRATAGRSASS